MPPRALEGPAELVTVQIPPGWLALSPRLAPAQPLNLFAKLGGAALGIRGSICSAQSRPCTPSLAPYPSAELMQPTRGPIQAWVPVHTGG